MEKSVPGPLAVLLTVTHSAERLIFTTMARNIFRSYLGNSLHSPPANGKQELVPEEMSQTLLTNKKQGNLE